MSKYVIAKTSRCYYGGDGAQRLMSRETTDPLEFDSIIEACKFAVDDGNQLGFDVYEWVEKYSHNAQFGGEPQEPLIRWKAVRAIVEHIRGEVQ